jgi:hypothetical protein
MTKEKLIKEYKEKIEQLDIKLEFLKKDIKEYRENDQPMFLDAALYVKEKVNSQRQIYIQKIHDLEEE